MSKVVDLETQARALHLVMRKREESAVKAVRAYYARLPTGEQPTEAEAKRSQRLSNKSEKAHEAWIEAWDAYRFAAVAWASAMIEATTIEGK